MPSEETAKPAEKAEKTKKTKKTDQPKGERRSRKKLIGIIIAAAAVVAAAIAAIIIIINLNHGDDEKTVFDTDAFFLPENDKTDSKYALFKDNGERLTEFEFSGIGEFVNGYALVRNTEDKYGIIGHDGKMTVNFGDYNSIRSLVGFYEVTEGEDENSSKKLILGNGHEVATDYKDLISDHSSPYIIVQTDDNSALYNVYGDRLEEYSNDDEPEIGSYSSTTVSYVRTKNRISLLNNQSLKVMINYESDKKYEIESTSKDRSIVVLRDKDSKKDGNYAVYRDNKITEYGDQCKSISLHSETATKRTFLSCKDDDKNKLIRDGEVSDIIADTYGSEYRVYDERHFAKYDSEAKRVDFYVDGEKKSSADASFAPSVSLKGYYIRNNDKKSVSLYSIEGEQIYTLNETSYGDLAGLDANNNIVVRDPNQETEARYYVVNEKGETISDKYSYLSVHGAYYVAKKSNKESALLDKDGQVIISGDYRDFSFYDDDKIIFARGEGDKLSYIDLNNKSEKFSISGSVYYNSDGYIKVVEKGKISYYAKSGEKIHEYSTD